MTESAPTRRSRRQSTAQVAVLGVAASDAAAAGETAIEAAAPMTAGTPEVLEAPAAPADASASAAPMTRRRARREMQSGASVPEATAPSAQVRLSEAPASTVPVVAVGAPVAPPLPDVAPAGEAAPAREGVAASANVVDEFAAAARLFCFTGETAIQPSAATDEGAGATTEAVQGSHEITRRVRTAHRAARAPRVPGRRRASARRIAAASFSLGAMTFVGLLTVGMTVPAQAVAAVNAGNVTVSAAGAVDADTIAGASKSGIQAYVAPSQVQNESLDREGSYSTATSAQMASDLGISNFSTGVFTNNPNSNIQWPFAVGVPISYGFGPRPGGFHHGVDFTPGQGAEVQAIADGVVRYAEDGNGVFGVNVLIDHIIDGKLVSSHYCHMEHGSLKVKTGDRVKVGQLIGLVGATGYAFGAHLHFEIWADGTMESRIDPLAWLYKYTTGTHTVTG